MQNSDAPKNTTGLAQKQHMETEGIFPVKDEVYNLVTALSNELEGLSKYQQYAKQDQGRFWKDVVALKKQLAELFTHEVGEHAKEGAFGSGEHRFSGKPPA